MPTPIRRRFAVDTLLQDKVATVDVLNRAGFITTNDLFSGERYRILTPDSYADEVDAVSHPVEFKWLQTHFFSMDFPTVDYLTGIGKKRFIAELMPKYPIYVNLLSNEARAVIGQTHEKTRPAIKMLQDEGFVNRGYVDIFDAGPTVECDVKHIRSVRRSQKLAVLVGEPIGGHTYLVCNARFEQYRACYGNIRVDLDKHEAIIPPKMAAALKVESGDMVRVVDLE